MKKTKISTSALFAFAIFAAMLLSFSNKKEKEPWKHKQLLPASVLAKILNYESVPKPLIYNLGPSGQIRNSIYIGEGKSKKNLKKLKIAISTLSKDADIVIYCGCCPFKDCPNIRPAFKMLNDKKFTNHKLLDLPNNLKVDWIDKGYPMAE